MPNFQVKDLRMAKQGLLKLDWAETHMPVLMAIRRDFEKNTPLKGLKVGACLHVTKETGVLARTLKSGGALVALTASNPLSTQDDVAAALAQEGISVFAWRGETAEEYYKNIGEVIATNPQVTMDDGADMVSILHKLQLHAKDNEINLVRKVIDNGHRFIENVIGGTEETTTGVIRLRAMAHDGALKYPIIAVNDARSKRLFDNPIGTGQSTIDGILRATNVLLAGKRVVVAGFGQVGSGIAKRARGMGALVTIVEVDPVKALEAAMYGFHVDSMSGAAQYGDVFITATGDIDAIRGEHIKKMKDNAIICNSGHFNVEISIPELEKLSVRSRNLRPDTVEYTLNSGRRVILLAEGRLVNLACAEGHPSEVMDLSFSIQALTVKYLNENREKLLVEVIDVPRKIDDRVAKLKLKAMGLKVEQLTPKQKKYLTSWEEGTV